MRHPQTKMGISSGPMTSMLSPVHQRRMEFLPQGIASAASLSNILTDDNARISRTLNMLKNMDDWMLHAKNIQELETKLVKFLEFCKSKNLKLKRSEFMIGSEIEFGGSIVPVEKVQNQDLIFITPKLKRIRALEELRKPQTKIFLQE